MDLFARAVEAVRAAAGVDRVVLVGHSMGTPVVRQFYRLFPKKTLGLVAVDGSLRPFFTKPEQIVAPDHELEELTQSYVQRGLDPHLAHQVAVQMHEADPLGSHLRDELGITEESRARPLQAAAVSALSFATAGLVPIIAMIVSPHSLRVLVIAAAALIALALLGAIGGRLGGAPRGRAAVRVVIGGGLAMAVTALIGSIIGAAGL